MDHEITFTLTSQECDTKCLLIVTLLVNCVPTIVVTDSYYTHNDRMKNGMIRKDLIDKLVTQAKNNFKKKLVGLDGVSDLKTEEVSSSAGDLEVLLHKLGTPQ